MLKNKKLFLLDIDGTVCQGERLIDGTKEFLQDLKNRGGQFVFITKNLKPLALLRMKEIS